MTAKSVAPLAAAGMRAMFRQSFATMNPVERRRVIGMYGSILALHAVGFALFIAYVLPAHYKFFGIGLSITAYTLGLQLLESQPLPVPSARPGAHR